MSNDVVFPIDISDEFAEYCASWHGGQTSPMYSVASTKTIHSEEILRGLITEINNIIAYCTRMGEEHSLDESITWMEMVKGFLPDKPLIEDCTKD
jgi:hypothetical protein